MAKPKIALYWCSSCGGCEESVLDLAEDLLELAGAAEIVFWPVAMDFKYADVAAMADGEIAATLINGAIRTEEHEKTARLLRRKSRLVMAHGACAHLGGVAGLANFHGPEELLQRAYREAPTLAGPGNPAPRTDEPEPGTPLPRLCHPVRPLDGVVEVDYYLPGCPPPPGLMKEALGTVIENRLPERGSVLAENRALCETCPRNEGGGDEIRVREFKRLHETLWDPGRCFLPQGLVCLGPATRGGCGARCIRGNMPCRGCFGPAGNVTDQGAKSLSFLASLIEAVDAQELDAAVDSLPDPAGLFYLYSLASSILAGGAARGEE